MNPGTARFEASHSQRHRAASSAPARSEPWRQPLVMWALVLAAAMLSFYVHVLNDHVIRSDAQRAALRSAPSAPAAQYAANVQRASPSVRVAQTTPR